MMNNDEIELLRELLKKAEETVIGQFNKIAEWRRVNYVSGMPEYLPFYGRYNFVGIKTSDINIRAIIQWDGHEEFLEEFPIDASYADGIIAEATKEREIILQRIKYEAKQKLQSDRALYEKLKAKFGWEEA